MYAIHGACSPTRVRGISIRRGTFAGGRALKIAIIPARGGSKRIPRKNIRDFCGKPILAYSIDTALQSKLFDQVVVSTDDAEIGRVARQYGAQTPFVRPTQLADDHAGTLAVIRHAIEAMQTPNNNIEYACCIYATAPFVKADDLRRGLDILLETGAEIAFSVTSFSYPVQRAIRINKSGRVEMFNPDNYRKRSQDLEAAYHDAGQFYWGKSSAFFSDAPIFSDRSAPVAMPRLRVQDIDTPEDWDRAELMYSAWQAAGGL